MFTWERQTQLPSPTERCAHCPCKPELRCESYRHKRYCELADPSQPGSEVWRKWLAATAEGQAVTLEDFVEKPVLAEPRKPDPAPIPAEGPPPPPVHPLAQAILACPHRQQVTCCQARCAQGKGNAGIVTWDDCTTCMDAQA